MAFFDIFKKKQDNSAAQASEERKQQQEELNAGLEKTKTGLFSKLARAVAGRLPSEPVLFHSRPLSFGFYEMRAALPQRDLSGRSWQAL